MNYYHTRLQGWSEFTAYYKEQVRLHKTGIFVEVGVWRGRSAIAMAEFMGSEEHQAELSLSGEDLYTSLLEHIKAADVKDYIEVMRASSAMASRVFPSLSCDFVYLDASHDHDNVYQDLTLWWPKVKNGGTLAGHDWSSNWPGVVSAVNQFSLEIRRPIIEHGSTWVIKKP